MQSTIFPGFLRKLLRTSPKHQCLLWIVPFQPLIFLRKYAELKRGGPLEQGTNIFVFSMFPDSVNAVVDAFYSYQLHLTRVLPTMFTLPKAASSLFMLLALFSVTSISTLNGKNPGCNTEIHNCPGEENTANLAQHYNFSLALINLHYADIKVRQGVKVAATDWAIASKS